MIVINYGMPKTGTTLAFEMARAVLELNGHPQRWLGEQLVEGSFDVNFVSEWSDERLSALVDATRGERIVLKTHRGVGLMTERAVLDAIDAGDLKVHVVLRDPRDTILSMIDSAVRARVGGNAADTSVDGAIQRLGGRVHELRWWGSFPCLELRYEEYAFDRTAGPELIAKDLGVTVDADEVWRRVDGRFTQFNVGRPERYKTDLWPDEAERIARAFPVYLDVVRANPCPGFFRPHR